MSSFNKVILLGNLTRDPETRTTSVGLTVGKLSLAINEHYSDRDGGKQERVTFVEVDAFGKQAEVLQKYCRKGKPLLIEGRLKIDQWENADGQKRSKLGVVCEKFQFIPDGSGRSDRSDG